MTWHGANGKYYSYGRIERAKGECLTTCSPYTIRKVKDLWRVYKDGDFIGGFPTLFEAQYFCEEHSAR